MGRHDMSGRTDFYMEGREFLAESYHYVESGLDSIFLQIGRAHV